MSLSTEFWSIKGMLMASFGHYKCVFFKSATSSTIITSVLSVLWFIHLTQISLLLAAINLWNRHFLYQKVNVNTFRKSAWWPFDQDLVGPCQECEHPWKWTGTDSSEIIKLICTLLIHDYRYISSCKRRNNFQQDLSH